MAAYRIGTDVIAGRFAARRMTRIKYDPAPGVSAPAVGLLNVIVIWFAADANAEPTVVAFPVAAGETKIRSPTWTPVTVKVCATPEAFAAPTDAGVIVCVTTTACTTFEKIDWLFAKPLDAGPGFAMAISYELTRHASS
jgi:hypothetical protein